MAFSVDIFLIPDYPRRRPARRRDARQAQFRRQDKEYFHCYMADTLQQVACKGNHFAVIKDDVDVWYGLPASPSYVPGHGAEVVDTGEMERTIVVQLDFKEAELGATKHADARDDCRRSDSMISCERPEGFDELLAWIETKKNVTADNAREHALYLILAHRSLSRT